MPVIVSKANKSLIVPYRLKSIFPDGQDWFMGPGGMSAIAPPTHLLLPHGMRETLILRHMGFKVPNPMELYYEFPHPQGEEPFRVQKVTCQSTCPKTRALRAQRYGNWKNKDSSIGHGTILHTDAAFAGDYLSSANCLISEIHGRTKRSKSSRAKKSTSYTEAERIAYGFSRIRPTST